MSEGEYRSAARAKLQGLKVGDWRGIQMAFKAIADEDKEKAEAAKKGAAAITNPRQEAQQLLKWAYRGPDGQEISATKIYSRKNMLNLIPGMSDSAEVLGLFTGGKQPLGTANWNTTDTSSLRNAERPRTTEEQRKALQQNVEGGYVLPKYREAIVKKVLDAWLDEYGVSLEAIEGPALTEAQYEEFGQALGDALDISSKLGLRPPSDYYKAHAATSGKFDDLGKFIKNLKI